MRKILFILFLGLTVVSAINLKRSSPMASRLLKWFIYIRLSQKFPRLGQVINRLWLYKAVLQSFSLSKRRRVKKQIRLVNRVSPHPKKYPYSIH